MLLEVLSGEFGWLNNNVSTSMVPSEYKKAWSQWLGGSIKALNSSPLVASQGASVKVDKKGVHIAVSGSTFDYNGNVKIKAGKIIGGFFTEYSRTLAGRDSIRVSGLKVPAKQMLASIPVLTLPDNIKSELLSYRGKAPGYAGDPLQGAYGFGDKDTISGDYQYIRGGGNDDTLTGGSSANIFIFESPDKNGIDLITNFNRSQGDSLQIDLGNNYSGGFSYGQSVTNNGDTAQVEYSGTDSFATAVERFHLNTSTGGLSFDADGNEGASAPKQIAVLAGLSDLQLSDFQFVY
jgi:hypothetical protein